MLDILKRIAKPIGTTLAILISLGAVVWFSDPKYMNYNRQNFDPFKDIYDDDRTDSEKKTVVLHADELRQLRWMSTSQLETIFRNHRNQFQVESSPAAFQELRWMSTSQLRAIFGVSDIYHA